YGSTYRRRRREGLSQPSRCTQAIHARAVLRFGTAHRAYKYAVYGISVNGKSHKVKFPRFDDRFIPNKNIHYHIEGFSPATDESLIKKLCTLVGAEVEADLARDSLHLTCSLGSRTIS
ncbi:hypothetical protein PRIPAC_75614, partial [Pristionchus pacificus]